LGHDLAGHESLLHVDEGFERLVLDVNGREPGRQRLRAFGGDEGHGLTDVANVFPREGQPIGLDERKEVPARDIVGREDRADSRYGTRARRIHVEDACVGMRRPDRPRIESAGGADVAHVAGSASGFVRPVVASGALADDHCRLILLGEVMIS
jgi:hypothetical protein